VETTKAITDRLANEGYSFANVNPVPELDRDKRIAGFTFFVDVLKQRFGLDFAFANELEVEGGKLTVVPQLSAPAGARLRYEMVSEKQGGAGKSSTSQSGSVSVGADGAATLSRLSLGVGAQDKYVIRVKVFDGAKLVAEETLSYPQ